MTSGEPVATTSRLQALRRFFTSLPFIVWLTTRIAYVLTSWMGLTLLPALFYHDEGRQPLLQPYPWIDGFCRWDCGWFIRIVQDGYNTVENAKVFPLLPLIGWSVEKVTGLHHIIVFIITANLASLASYFVIYRLFRELEGDEAAKWGLLLFTAFPFAYYQAAAYPESLMVLATAWAILLAKRQRHLSAGLVLGLGVMARHLTLSGGAGLIVAQVRQRGLHPKKLLLHPGILGLLIPWVFLALFSWYLKVHTGDPLAFWNSRKIGWNDWVWYGARQVILNIPYSERPEYYYYILLAIPAAVGAGWLLRKKAWAELAAHGIVLMAVVLSSGAAGMGRYTASCWPVFLPWGLWLAKKPNLQAPLLAALWLMQGLFWFLFTHQWRVL